MTKRFKFGDIVTIDGCSQHSLDGRRGVVLSYFSPTHLTVRLIDDVGRKRVFHETSLRLEKETIMAKRVNFKTFVAELITKLFTPLAGDSPKEKAVRRLGIAYELCSRGEAEKKKAKTECSKLGIITDAGSYPVGPTSIFDSPNYAVTAVTKNPAKRLNEAALRAELKAYGMGEVRISNILDRAMVESKPSTSFVVEAK